MGEYFDPPLELKKVGRPVGILPYQELRKELREGEVLFGLFRWEPDGFYHAPYLPDEQEYQGFAAGQSNELRITFPGGRSIVASGRVRACLGYYAVAVEDLYKGGLDSLGERLH